jgi:hypothetical protein
MNLIEDSADGWLRESGEPREIVVGFGNGVLTVSITVPRFLKPEIIDLLNERIHELFHVIDQINGRGISEVPVVRSQMLAGLEEDWVCWSRDYSDPEYPEQFTEALEAVTEMGIAPSIH